MATYVNNLRLTELATGEGSGTWGTTTNTSLELIGEALGYNTQNCFSSDADATTTIADGATDPARAFYFKVTSSATLTATRTLTIAPNTISRVMFIENATTGSQSITISQGSGANVTIATGRTAVVYLDGAGSGAAVVDAMANVDPGITDTLAEVLAAGNTSGGTGLTMSSGDDLTLTGASYNAVWDSSDSALEFGDNAKAVFGAGSDLQIYHTGTYSLIADTSGTGPLRVVTNTFQLNNAADTQNMINAAEGGAVNLYHAGNAKLATTSTGIDVTGVITTDGMTTSANINFGDNDKAIFGADSDLQIYHDGTDNVFDSSTTFTFDGETEGKLIFKDSGTSYGRIDSNGAAGFDITSEIQDGDLRLRGNDGGLTINALTLDMSAAGAATFNGNLTVNGADVTVTSNIIHAGDTDTYYGFHGNNEWRVVTGGFERIEVSDSGFISNDGGYAGADFRVESDSNSHMLFVDAGNNRVGINQSAPSYDLDINGTLQITGTIRRAGSVIFSSTGSLTEIGPGGDGSVSFHKSANMTTGDEMAIFSASEAVFNQRSFDQDFRVESDSNANQLFVDAGNSLTYVGSNTTTTIPSANGFGVKAGGEKTVVLESTAADTLLLFRDSGTTTPPYIGSFGDDLAISGYGGGTPNVGIGITAPQSAFHINQNGGPQASGDMTTGLIVSNGTAGTAIQMGTNDAGGYGYIKSAYVNSANTARALLLYAGTDKAVSIESNTVIMNDDSLDRDFRVESNSNTHMLFVDAGNDRVGINHSSPAAPLHILGATKIGIWNSADFPLDISTGLGSQADPAFGYLRFTGYLEDVKSQIAGWDTTTNNANTGKLSFQTKGTDGLVERFAVVSYASTYEIIANDTGQDQDFRVESNNNANMLFVDAGNDVVVIGGTTAETADTLEVISSDTSTNVRIRNTNAGDDGPILIFDKASASPAANDNVGDIRFIGKDSAGNAEQYARFLAESSNVTSGAEDGFVSLEMVVNGTNRQIYNHSEAGTTFNDLSVDLDFRVESDSHAHALFVDAGANNVGIFDSSPSSSLSVNSPDSTTVSLELNGGSGNSKNLLFKQLGTTQGKIRTVGDVMEFGVGSSATEIIRIDIDGLKFKGDTAAASALDDYEEGTFTPAFRNVTATYDTGTTAGQYVKIGRMVYYTAVITTDALDTTDTDSVEITLPFASTAGQAYFSPVTLFVEEGFNDASAEAYQAIVVEGQSYLRMYSLETPNSGFNYNILTYQDLTDGTAGTRVRFSGAYLT